MTDLIERQAAIDAIESAFDRETILNRFLRKIANGAKIVNMGSKMK